jgi:hypothetical protein
MDEKGGWERIGEGVMGETSRRKGTRRGTMRDKGERERSNEGPWGEKVEGKGHERGNNRRENVSVIHVASITE